MKKIIALVLILASLFALCACGQQTVTEKVVEKEVEKEVEVPVIPEEYEKYQGLIDALEAADYDTATEIFTGFLPVPEAEPVTEVQITPENFFDYFEYQEFPADNLNFKRNTAGVIYELYAASGFYLKDGYKIAQEKAADCTAEVGVKYQVQLFYAGNKGINVDPANCSYEITLKANDVSDEDELIEGTYALFPDGDEFYAFLFDFGTQISSEKDAVDLIIDADSIELVSASGTLYLAQ